MRYRNLLVGLCALTTGAWSNPVEGPAVSCYAAFDWRDDRPLWPDAYRHNGSGVSPGAEWELYVTTSWQEIIHSGTEDGRAEGHHTFPCAGNG